jgi:hypothetical protein
MPVASIYIERKTKHVLQNGGFEEFPYAVPRWYKVAGEKYGRSPGHDRPAGREDAAADG